MSELTKRVLSALVLAPIAIAAVGYGGAALAALLAVASALAAWEFYRIARATGEAPFEDIGIAVAGLIPLAVHAHFLELWTVPLAVGATVVLVLFAFAIWRRGVAGRPLAAVSTTLLGIVYTGGMLSFGYAIRYFDYVRFYDASLAPPLQLGGLALRIAPGAALVVLPLIVTWASDIGAYFVGRAVGGAKLIPSVSPGKTRSGAIGGVVASILLAWLYVTFVLRPVAQVAFTTWGMVLFGIAISVAAQVGDLVESLLKREGGVKDSSQLIPGHGGILDRFDSLLFVMPVAWLLLGWLVVPAPVGR